MQLLLKTMLKTKNIGLDFDDVIIDHTKTKIDFVKKIDIKISPKQSLGDILKKILNKQQYKETKEYIYEKATYSGKEQKDFRKYLNKLIKLGYKLFIISRRTSKISRKEAIKWLVASFPEIFSSRNIFFVDSDTEKYMICKKLKINIFIDNKPSVLKYLKSVEQKFLFNPFKISFDFNKNKIKTAYSWQDFFKKIGAK